MDDTRDIAIRAEEAGASAHQRLNTINGQIRRLGDSHEKMRGDFAEATGKLAEDFSDANLALVREMGAVVTSVAEVKTTLTTSLKVAGVIAVLLVSVVSGVTVYEVTHLPRPVAPAQAHVTQTRAEAAR